MTKYRIITTYDGKFIPQRKCLWSWTDMGYPCDIIDYAENIIKTYKGYVIKAARRKTFKPTIVWEGD